MILVFGKRGQVARELALRAPDARFLSREDADLTDPAACAAAILAARPEAVINAAAYTAVDRAESEEDLAYVVNGRAPGAMAVACAELGIPFVHLSTEYVFDCEGSAPFPVDARTAPVNAYGRSKLAGEEAVRAAGGTFVILRTSWVFASHGTNFVRTMLRLGAEHERLTVVEDQVGGPTPAGAIAEACLSIVRLLQADPARAGTYHFCGLPYVSRADLAREILHRAGSPAIVEGVPSSDFPTPAKRPPNSRLDCGGLEEIGLSPPDWRAALSQVIEDLATQ